MKRILPVLALGLAMAGHATAAAGELDAAKDRLDAARAEVVSGTSELGVPDAPEAVGREWSAIEGLVAADLDVRGKPQSDLGVKGLSVALVSLGGQTYLVTADMDGLGTLFVVRIENGEFRTAWRIADLSNDRLAAFPLLGAWSAQAASEGCANRGDGTCGPMTASIARLPDDDRGRARFSVNGYRAAQNGSDLGYQLSIWTWDGAKAVPELAGFYMQTMDMPIDLGLKAPFLSLKTKEAFKTFYVTAPEPGRQAVWTILLMGEGVHDLGRRSTVPELDAVDELFARILEGRKTDALARPRVRSVLVDALEQSDIAPGAREDTALGELWDGEVTRAGNDTLLCFGADPVGFLRFRMRSEDGRFFVTHVHRLDSMDVKEDPCTGHKF